MVSTALKDLVTLIEYIDLPAGVFIALIFSRFR